MKKDPRFQPVDAAVTPRFAGIATFMRTQRHDVSSDLDIALVGVPFDIGVNYRAGARQGPAAVREASRLIRRVHSTSGIAPYDLCNVADVGDAPVNPIDLARSIAMIEAFFAQIHAAGAIPLSIGGDHTVPLAHPAGPGEGPARWASSTSTAMPTRWTRLPTRKHQSRHDLPARRGGGADRPEAHHPDRSTRLALLARRHQVGPGRRLHLHHLR